MSGAGLLEIEGLTLTVSRIDKEVVSDFSLELAPGEIVGIVGESGSGKSMAARAIMRLEPPAVSRRGGSIRFDGKDVCAMPQRVLRRMRGGDVGMVFQEPLTSLNPSMRIGSQLEEGLKLHRRIAVAERRRLILDMLGRVGLRDPEAALEAYPHEFSGGMRQRIMLASVMLLKPRLLIADEPTTALDAVVQREVLDLMLQLTRTNGTAVLLISHDLPMIARYTNRIVVMRQGRIVEEGATDALLEKPQHSYTRQLLAAMPRRTAKRGIDHSVPPLVEVRDLIVDYGGRKGFLRRDPGKRALRGVSLSIRPREVVAIVGESGSGKTTLGRSIAGLVKPSGGSILYGGHSILPGSEGWPDYRLNCQMIFQDPYSSLDPRIPIGATITEALRHGKALSAAEKHARVIEILGEVGLSAEFAKRYPHELSGGQRQRVAIARALVRKPAFVIADEPVSALDVTVRMQVLDLLTRLQERHGFSCLFISHDLSVVEQIADRVVVMRDGAIVEEGSRDAIFDGPRDSYTRRLLSAIPTLEGNPEGGVRLVERGDCRNVIELPA